MPCANEDRAEILSDAIEGWDVGGIYLIAEHPGSEYLVTDPMWVARILDIVAGARIGGKTVLIGYARTKCWSLRLLGRRRLHLAAGSMSGGFHRRDSTSRARTRLAAAQLGTTPRICSRNSNCNISISLGGSDGFQPSRDRPVSTAHFAAALFSGAQPTTVDFGESSAFRHYLHCVRQQVGTARQPTYRETILEHERLLGAAEAQLTALRRRKHCESGAWIFRCRGREQGGARVLEATRGPILSREWTSI